MKFIKLRGNKNKFTLVNDEDFEKLNQYKWGFDGSYAVREEKMLHLVRGKKVYLHRKLLNDPQGLEVDHINHNKLDNRKENLRIVTHQQNNWNNRLRATNTSGYTGVYLDKRRLKWDAMITVDKKNIYLGSFKEKAEAARAYQSAKKRHHSI